MELGGPSVYAHEVVEQHVDATLRLAARCLERQQAATSWGNRDLVHPTCPEGASKRDTSRLAIQHSLQQI